MTPSAAALSLFNQLPLPAGTVTVWPLTIDGQIKLVVTLDKRYWNKIKQMPTTYEGFNVVVEPPMNMLPQRM
jgi:hypothetical protein